MQEKGDRYYGSDLNRFVDENCTHEMTAINIDLFLYRRSVKRLRVVESKHSREGISRQGMSPGQSEALQFLARVLNDANRLDKYKDWDFSLVLARGDEPYNRLEVRNLATKEKQIIEGQENVIRWLECTDR